MDADNLKRKSVEEHENAPPLDVDEQPKSKPTNGIKDVPFELELEQPEGGEVGRSLCKFHVTIVDNTCTNINIREESKTKESKNVTSTEECIEYITSKIEKTKLLLVVTMEMKIELAQDGLSNSLVKQIVLLENLVMLDLTSVHLPKSLDSDLQFGNLVNLETLILDDTNLRLLHSSVGQLRNLKLLSLQYNRLYDLPVTIRLLRQLRHLKITGNLFRALPGAIFHLKKLETLEGLNENLLERYPNWNQKNLMIVVIDPLVQVNPPRSTIDTLQELALNHSVGMDFWSIPLPDQYRDELILKTIRYDLCEECMGPVKKIMADQETNGYMIKICLAQFNNTRSVPFNFLTCSNTCKTSLLERLTHIQKSLIDNLSHQRGQFPEVKLKEEHVKPIRIRKHDVENMKRKEAEVIATGGSSKCSIS